MNANKSFSTETSERYSRALFEVSKESNELDNVESGVKDLQSLLQSSLEFKNFIKDPTQSINQQISVINFLATKLKFTKKQFKINKIEHIKYGKFHASLKKDFDEFLKLIIKEEIKNNAEKLKAVGSSRTPKLKNISPFFVS